MRIFDSAPFLLDFKQDQFSASVFFELDFAAPLNKVMEEAVALDVNDASLALNIKEEDFVFTISLADINIKALDTLRSKVGPQDETKFIAFLNENLPKLLPTINGMIPTVTIPKRIGGVEFTNIEFSARPGYGYFQVAVAPSELMAVAE